MFITIDGPNGSGKTTLAVLIAKHLNFFCFSSGYIYRALAYILKNFYGYDAAKFQAIDLNDIQAILANNNFKYEYQYGIAKVYWKNDITSFLKDLEISQLAATIAKNEQVRLLVRQYEKNIVLGKDVVIEGRACGSIVYPNADLKFYIQAPVAVRAQRLVHDQEKRGHNITFQQALQKVIIRDEMDRTREIEPLQIPKDAIILDSEKYKPEELLQKVLHEVQKYLKIHKNNL